MKHVVLNIFTITKLAKCKQFQLNIFCTDIFNMCCIHINLILGKIYFILGQTLLSSGECQTSPFLTSENISSSLYVVHRVRHHTMWLYVVVQPTEKLVHVK